MKLLLVGQDDSLPGGMPAYIRSLRDYLAAETEIEFRYLNETEAKGRSDMHRPGGPALFGQALKLRSRLVDEIKSFRPDVVHLHVAHGLSIFEKAYLARVCAGLGVPAVIHMHGAGLVENVERLPQVARRYLASAFGAPHQVVALSASIAAELAGAFPGWSITVIPNAVELPKHPAPLPETFTVGFLGFMDGRKGEQDLVEALAKANPAVKAIFAGDGPNFEAVQMRAKELKLNSVTFAGRVGGETKDAFLRSISALCLPSYAENYPIALLEAMAYGRTVIASAVGGVPDLVIPGENGWLFKAGDVDTLALELDEASANPEEVCRMGRESLRTVTERHVWQVTGPTLVRLYEACAGGIRRSAA